MEAVDEFKPSLFELLAEQQLSSLLPPTIRYLLTVLTHRYPRYLLRVLNSYDEIYALVMLVVERHFLKTRGGSFVENFYGLKRERGVDVDLPRARATAPVIVREQLQLGTADIWRNLLVLVGIPYIRRKLEEHHEINAPRVLLGSAYTRLPANPTLKQRLIHYYRWFLLNIYPRAHAVWGLLLLAHNLAYISGKSQYHDVLMRLVQTRVRRMGPADYQAIDMVTKAAEGSARGRTGLPLLSPRGLGLRVLSSLSLALPASIFALKFLEWWYATDFAKQLARKATEDLMLDPPVAPGLVEAKMQRDHALKVAEKDNKADSQRRESEHEKQDDSKTFRGHSGLVTDPERAPVSASTERPILTVLPPQDSSLCPICQDEIMTPTASQSGVVYCYSCIHRWVEGVHPKQEQFMVGKEGVSRLECSEVTRHHHRDTLHSKDSTPGAGHQMFHTRLMWSKYFD